MNGIERLSHLVSGFLRLYPAAFRAEFTAEMIFVIRATLIQAAERGQGALLRALLRETCGLLFGAVKEHRRAYQSRHSSSLLSQRDSTNLTRLLARGIAVLGGVWWLLILLWNEDVRAVMLWPLSCVVGLALSGAAIEPWRRRTAGWMVLSSGLLVASMMVVSPWQRGAPINLLVAILVALPLLIAGSLMLDADMLHDRRSGAFLTSGLGWVVLAMSWWFLYVFAAALTERWLVPWDTWGEPIRPPIGAWPRTVNDFFESGIGASLPGVLLVGGGGLVFLMCIRNGSRFAIAPWLVAVANLLVITINLLTLPFVDWLYHPTTAEEIGFGYTWPGILIMALSCGVFVAFARLRLFQEVSVPGHEVPS